MALFCFGLIYMETLGWIFVAGLGFCVAVWVFHLILHPALPVQVMTCDFGVSLFASASPDPPVMNGIFITHWA